MSKFALTIALAAAALVSGAAAVHAQTKPANPAFVEERGLKRPALLFREQWKSPTGKEVELTAPNSMVNPDLELHVLGPPGTILKGSGHDGDPNDPPHVFSGECKGPCGFTLRSKKSAADLSGLALIRVETKTSGFHHVYPVVKLASGEWYIGDKPQGGSLRAYITTEFDLYDITWTTLDPANLLTKGNPVGKIDLSKVEEVGFADLMPSSGHGPGGWFDVANFEVFGKPVAR